MTNVLHVSTFFAANGGVEKSVTDLASGLLERHEVEVLCTERGTGTRRYLDETGVLVTSVGSPFAVSGRPLPFSFPRELKRKAADVVHYHLPFPLAAGSHLIARPSTKISVATWHHDMVRNPHVTRCIKPIMEAFLDSMDAILVGAPPLIERTELLSSRRDKCRVVPLGVSPRTAKNDSQPRLSNQKLMILFVGRLVYYKGCDVLIKAIKDIDAELVIVGEGPLRRDFENLVADLNLGERVHFKGRLPDDDLAQLYEQCDIFVLPSTLPTECFGLVQVEAMLAGKPVINTDLPTGVPWVSQHNITGLTVAPNDERALNAALQQLAGDPGLRNCFGRAAKERANRLFTLATHVRSVESVYEELLSKKNRQLKSPERTLIKTV